MAGSGAIDPLRRFGKVATSARAPCTFPTLQDVDRVNQHREHQTLFTGQWHAADIEVLRRQDDIGLRQYLIRAQPRLFMVHVAPPLQVARCQEAPKHPSSSSLRRAQLNPSIRVKITISQLSDNDMCHSETLPTYSSDSN